MFIYANWKLNFLTKSLVVDYFSHFYRFYTSDNRVVVGFAPPVVYLNELPLHQTQPVELLAQDCSWVTATGAYTGEVSPLMLKNQGVNRVIIGHSERRRYFFESDDIINKKIIAALAAGLKIILCIGEPIDVYEQQQTVTFLAKQLSLDLKNISPLKLSQIVIAYEPIWAIGTGKTASSNTINFVVQQIKDYLVKKYEQHPAAQSVSVIYGGSVNPNNIKNLLLETNVDGFLVGGSSHDPQKFITMINIMQQHAK